MESIKSLEVLKDFSAEFCFTSLIEIIEIIVTATGFEPATT